jgi:glycosyltransferase involved in cell wall biosynthesis
MTNAGSAPLAERVTPVCNGARFLGQTMECVQSQSYPNNVHYVLNDARNDATSEIIDRFRGRRWFH